MLNKITVGILLILFSAVFINFRTSDSLISVELVENLESTIFIDVSNNFDEDLSVFVSDIPDGTLEKDLFSIKSYGSEVEYVGKVVYRNDSIDNWVRFGAYSTKRFTVNLINGYSFIDPGYYSVTYNSYISIIRESGEREVIYVKSDEIAVDIILPAYAAKATTRACSASDTNTLNKGLANAKPKTTNTLNYLDEKGGDSYYTKWFGIYNTERFNTVESGYRKIRGAMDNPITLNCPTSSICNGAVAYVYKNQPYNIWFCMNHINGKSAAYIGEVFMHEISHWNITMSTEDHVYGKSGCLDLAKKSPAEAIDNADNICFYPYDIPSLPVGPDPEPSDSLLVNESMGLDDQIFSANKKYKFKLRSNGQIVLNEVGVKNIWNSSTANKGGTILWMQGDGNLVLYNANHKPLWASGTVGKPVAKLQVLDTGKVVLKKANGSIVWSVPENNPDPPSPVEQVAIYGDINFQGYRVNLEAGRHYDLEDLKSLGSPNDSISSIRVANGFKAIVYQHHHFGGISYEIINDVSDLRTLNFNDEISSVIIRHKDDDPDPPDVDNWAFVVAGDTRTNDSAHRNVLKAIKNNTPDYELYINSGDVVADGTSTSQWNTFTNAQTSVFGSGWKNKYLACPGNHDKVESSSGLKNWRKYLPKQANYGDKGKHFKFTYRNAMFLILNADGDKTDQASFIKTSASNSSATWIFAVWHYPTAYSQWITPLRSIKFDGVFWGHQHKYVRTDKSDHFETIVGTGGAPLGTNNVYGYLECNVNGNRMTVKYRRASNGAVIDSATYTANKK